MNDSFLIEIGTEELPPKSLQTLAVAFHDGVVAGFTQYGLEPSESEWFATPRRLAVRIHKLKAKAEDTTETLLGPPVKTAKNEAGEWTPAALGFANKQGVSPETLIAIDTDKGERLAITRTVEGAAVTEVAATVINQALAELPIAKRMRWGSRRTEFVRPVHWVVCLYGDHDTFDPIFDLVPSRVSRGHRFHGPQSVVIDSPERYEAILESCHVVASFDKRRSLIRDQVITLADQLSLKANIAEDLLDEVTALVEWPVALAGSFDPDFLRVPSEALIASMKEHQKYFHLTNQNNELEPLFITIANIESPEPERIISGNERVIRPRLADAAFFFDTDLKTPLKQRDSELAKMTFQHQLGSVLDKVKRVQQLALVIAQEIGADAQAVEAASALCKSDLASELVNEFPELQGIAGGYYARAEGLDHVVAAAIKEHYLPRFASDSLPSSLEATAVALADRLDTLAGIFAIGETPSGSKDPFALRRSSLAVLRLLIENKLDCDLESLLDAAFRGLPVTPQEKSRQALSAYINERYYAKYEQDQISPLVVRSILNKQISRPLDFDNRVKSTHEFLGLEESLALASAYKRVANLLEKSDSIQPGVVNPALLIEPAEKELVAALDALQPKLDDQLKQLSYSDYLTTLASLRTPVDLFFDGVMVNSDNLELKTNRLAILQRLDGLFGAVADLKELA
ncbi:MAG TPA: glycine--tRNA ligase subunit beta [Halieaceae bacterium]|nr:glycine--tRNA ligase subunit beta [Halieaceae bacterium]